MCTIRLPDLVEREHNKSPFGSIMMVLITSGILGIQEETTSL